MGTYKATAKISERTISSFFKAMGGIAVRRQDRHSIALSLQTYGCIDDKTLSTSNAQIWMNENNCSTLQAIARHVYVRHSIVSI